MYNINRVHYYKVLTVVHTLATGGAAELVVLLERLALEAERIRGKMTSKDDGVVKRRRMEEHLIADTIILDKLHLLVRIIVAVGVFKVDLGVRGLSQGMVRAELDKVLHASSPGLPQEDSELARHVLATGGGIRRDTEHCVNSLEGLLVVILVAVPIEQNNFGRGG
jgi:hypothetical protein